MKHQEFRKMRKQLIAAGTAIVLGIATTTTGTIAFARGGGFGGGGHIGGLGGGGHVGGLGLGGGGHVGGLGLGGGGHVGGLGLGGGGHVGGLGLGGGGPVGGLGLGGGGHVGGLGGSGLAGHGIATDDDALGVPWIETDHGGLGGHRATQGRSIHAGHRGFGHHRFEGRRFDRGVYAYSAECGLGSAGTYSGFCKPNCYPHGCYGY